MANTIFWSWQSDLDGRITRDVIRYALDEAVKLLTAELEEADRPSITSDTQGVAGSPDIVATILKKIDEAAVFVGDVTPITVSQRGKACANPNVLLEMGYANKSLSMNRVIQVWNTAFEGASFEKLPFDMRGRRGPISFYLPSGAETNDLRRVREKLAKDIADALRLAIGQMPPKPAETLPWHPHIPNNPDLWFDRTSSMTVTNPRHGSQKVRWNGEGPGYARIIPSNWNATPGAKAAIASEDVPALLADANALGYGLSKGGAMIYWPGKDQDSARTTIALTQWFEKTGEFWGIADGFTFTSDSQIKVLAGEYICHHWKYFITRNCELCLKYGGSLPIHVKLGVNDLSESYWPSTRFGHFVGWWESVEESYEYNARLASVSAPDIENLVVDAFNGIAELYGAPPQSAEQIFPPR